ncbi:MAG: RidA family protein [Pseudomonadota bacterium]
MLTRHNPDAIAPTFSAYSHGVEVAPGARWLHISGQVGVLPDGGMADGPVGQMEQTWSNVLAVLAGAGMGPHDLVKVTAFVTRPEDVPLFRQVRDSLLEGAQPASTLVIVSGLAHPDWLVEIEAIAASVK